MACCPNCGRNWHWDWEEDAFKLLDGTLADVATEEDVDPEYQDTYEVTTCLCGQILLREIPGYPDTQAWVAGWEDIDWEAPGHRYPSTYDFETDSTSFYIDGEEDED